MNNTAIKSETETTVTYYTLVKDGSIVAVDCTLTTDEDTGDDVWLQDDEGKLCAWQDTDGRWYAHWQYKAMFMSEDRVKVLRQPGLFEKEPNLQRGFFAQHGLEDWL